MISVVFMKKKIIIYSLISIIAPLIILSALTALIDFKSKVGFIYIAFLILCIIYFLFLILLELKKCYIVFISLIVILNIVYILFISIALKEPYYGFIGLLVNGAAVAAHYSRWCYLLMPITAYPASFNLYGVNRYSLEIYAVVVLIALAFSIWQKYHRTKIYLYDNYGD